jgi:hypothetical protein
MLLKEGCRAYKLKVLVLEGHNAIMVLQPLFQFFMCNLTLGRIYVYRAGICGECSKRIVARPSYHDASGG